MGLYPSMPIWDITWHHMVYINVFPAQNTRLASGEGPISAGCHLSTAILQRSVAQDALLVGRPGECSNQNDEWTTREWGIQPAKISQKIAPYPNPPGKCGIKHESIKPDLLKKNPKNKQLWTVLNPRNPRYTPSKNTSLWRKQTIRPVDQYTNHHTQWFTYELFGMNPLLTS